MNQGKEKTELKQTPEESGEDDPGDSPVVLQCRQCNVVLGDSTSWVSTNDELDSLTLHSVTSMVVRGNQLVTSTEGIDLGSTYMQLECKSCKNVIGCMYRTTPRTLDELRDLFTLSISKIISYQIGSSKQTSGIVDSLNIKSTRDLNQWVTKTQIMVCSLNERVNNIEKAMQMEDDEEEDEEEDEINPTNGKKSTNNDPNFDSENNGVVENDPYESGLETQASRGKRVKDGSRHERNADEAEDGGRNVPVHAGKREKPQASVYNRNSKRTRHK